MGQTSSAPCESIFFVREEGDSFWPTLGLVSNLVRAGDHTSVSPRAVVAPRARGGLIFARLACAAYEFGLARRITEDWIVSRPELVNYYERLGYENGYGTTWHPAAGTVFPLRLDCTNAKHLAAIRSPFARILSEHFASLSPTSIRNHHERISIDDN
jgi:hypothetical protein